MAFEDDIVRDGIGRAIRVDVSTDAFATISYRYATVAGQLRPGFSEWYDERIISAPTLRRALGQDRIATAGGLSLELDNVDGALDWLTGHADPETIAKSRWRVYLVLFDPSTPGSPTDKLLGEYYITGWPRQTSQTVSLNLGDAMSTPLSMGLPLPTLADWALVGTPSTNPLRAGAGSGDVSYSFPDALTTTTPIQLAFGEDWVPALPPLLPYLNTNYSGYVIVPLYTTTSSAAASASDVTALRVRAWGMEPDPPPGGTFGEILVDVPSTFSYTDSDGVFVPNVTVWTVEKSPAITKAGKTFYVVYLKVKTHLGRPRVMREPGVAVSAANGSVNRAAYDARYLEGAGYSPEVVAWVGANSSLPSDNFAANPSYAGDYALYASRVTGWYVKGGNLSARTTSGARQHAVDVVRDLVEHYSQSGLSIDTTQATRVKAGSPLARAAGRVQPWEQFRETEASPSLRQVVTAIAQSSDIDVFVGWDGKVSFASDVWDFTVATQYNSLPTLSETRLSELEQWIAEDGERGAPFNRIMLEGAEAYWAADLDVPFQGPFDLDFTGVSGGVLLSTRVLETKLRQDWRPDELRRIDPIGSRSIDGIARSRVRFVSSLEALRIELGGYFVLNWTSNRSWPYLSPAVFQADTISYAAGDDTVEVLAVWRGDTTTARAGYLLDDETLLVRTKNASGTGEVNFTAATFTITSGTTDFTAMGVEPNDVLVLRDSSESATGFVRNKAVRIASVTSGTQLELVAGGSGTFSGIIDADWYVVRGALTYPTASSDPTNYPSDGEMYGKVTDSAGLFSDNSAGNLLISG